MPDIEIRERLDSWARALHAKDIDALMAHYAPDNVTFDLMPPLQVKGVDAYRKNFEAWFSAVKGPIDYEVSDLRIAAGEDIAFCHHTARVRCRRMSRERGEYQADYSVRVSVGYRKLGGEWKVVHEHVSMPLEMQALQARFAAA